MIMLVVVMLEMIMVIFLCEESAWLCVCSVWPIARCMLDVVRVVYKVVLAIVIVVICAHDDDYVHGKFMEEMSCYLYELAGYTCA